MNRATRIGVGIAVGILLLTALMLIFIFDPEVHPFFPQCPFLLTTGFECPGCGSQRAIHALLHLDLSAAIRANVFMVFALPYILIGIYLEYLGGKRRHPGMEKIFFGRWSALVVLLLILLYWVGRNLL